MPDEPHEAAANRAAWRIAIAGGGVAGLSLALALKQALGSALEVAVYDPALARDPAGDRRAYAIAAGDDDAPNGSVGGSFVRLVRHAPLCPRRAALSSGVTPLAYL